RLSGFDVRQVILNNCLLASTTEINNHANLHDDEFVLSLEHDQTKGTHKLWKRRGVIETEGATVKTAAPSIRFDPNTDSVYLYMDIDVPVTNGDTVDVSVQGRKDGNYNGSFEPSIIVTGQGCAGNDTLTVLANNWEELTINTNATASGIMKLRLRCDGTAGFCFFDDIKVTIS
ncbi:unnamed protein product, partial [marine sediment metagenome]